MVGALVAAPALPGVGAVVGVRLLPAGIVVVVTVLVIVPLRPQRVLTTAVLLWFTALRTLIEAVLDRTVGEEAPLRPLVRDVDAAYAALVATAAPLRRATFGRNSAQLTELLSVGAAARQYARSLAAGVEDADDPAWADDPAMRAGADQLRASLEVVEHRLRTGERGCYVRSAALVALTIDGVGSHESSLQHALRDLTVLDGALARLATTLQMDVADHDTGVGSAAGTPLDAAGLLRGAGAEPQGRPDPS